MSLELSPLPPDTIMHVPLPPDEGARPVAEHQLREGMRYFHPGVPYIIKETGIGVLVSLPKRDK